MTMLDNFTTRRRIAIDKAPSDWLTVHPRTPGLFWVSVEPSGRSPAPWVVLEPVFQIMITPAGDVFELCTIGGVAQFKEEPIYTTATIPKMGIGVKYRSAVESLPSDPWARKGRKATP